MREKIVYFTTIVTILIFGACSEEEVFPEGESGTGRTISLTVSMLDDDPNTRVDLNLKEDNTIAVTWVAGDQLQLLFVQGEIKLKRVVTLLAKNIKTNGKHAIFDIPIPKEITGAYNLYGVYGGGGLDNNNPTHAILPANTGDATSLASIQSRKDVMLYFPKKEIKPSDIFVRVKFEHLGSLFSIILKNSSAESLSNLTEARLISAEAGSWAFNTGAGGNRFDVVNGAFLNTEGAGNYLSFKAEKSSVPSGESITFWGWNPPLPQELWPELKLELRDATTSLITSLNYKPERTLATKAIAGRSYYFYAVWDGTQLGFTDQSLTPPLGSEGFDRRRDMAFESLRNKPLVRVPVKSPPKSGHARGFSYALIDYAFKSFWLNIDNAKANDALNENCDYYIAHPADYKDMDSFYWASDELCSIVELFGSNGSRNAGLVSKETEDKIFLMMWQYAKMQSKVAKTEYQISKTWHIDGSENHHIQRFYTAWHFAKFLKEQSQYKDLNYDDGFTAVEHYNAYTDYIKHWILERARKGLFIESSSPTYEIELLKGVYNFYDYGADLKMRQLAGKLLDLYWAVWAQEQFSGVRGGSKARTYPNMAWSGRYKFWEMSWFYLGINGIAPNVPRENEFTLLASSYRMPTVVIDIALDIAGRGEYEVFQRIPGLAQIGFSHGEYGRAEENGEIVRYSYCTPEFIAGIMHYEAKPVDDWLRIGSQNRWFGVTFYGDPNAKVFPQCMSTEAPKFNSTYNQMWGVQKKGSMIVHKLLNDTHSLMAGKMEVFISYVGLTDRVEKDGWVFVRSKAGGYVAIRPTNGGYTWRADAAGDWVSCVNEYSPVIIEVGSGKDFLNYTDFQNKVKALNYSVVNNILTYKSLNDDILTIPINYVGIPTINGAAIDVAPTKVFESPFINSVFNSGIVQIKKGSSILNLDFNF